MPGCTRTIEYVPGKSLRQIVERAGLEIRSGCNGNGTCGLCMVKVAGDIDPIPTRNERASIGEEMILQGYRLACQYVPREDVEAILPGIRRNSDWRPIADERPSKTRARPTMAADPDNGSGYAIAVDVGTTTIKVSLLDLMTRKRLAGLIRENPQNAYGSDVISRLVALRDEPECVRKMREETLSVIYQGILRLMAVAGLDIEDVDQARLVGNTTMISILGAADPLDMLSTRKWSDRFNADGNEETVHFSAFKMGSGLTMTMTPPLAGFVGSDAIAGIVATGLMDDPGPNLMIDLGTNTEVCLWDGKDLLITACAGGPAMEGVGMRCGSAIDNDPDGGSVLTSGAVCDPTALRGKVEEGLSGSALIDALAKMVQTGVVDGKGNFTGGDARTVDQKSGFVFTKSDIDRIMRAKSAVASGIWALLNKAGLPLDSLKKVYITGNFGQSLSIESAKRIGLLPYLPTSRFSVIGNASLMGCEDMLATPQARVGAEQIRRTGKLINLAMEPGFDDLFLENLYLRPMTSGPCTDVLGLNEYIRISQYIVGISDLRPEEEISRAIIRFMGGRMVGFAHQDPDGGLSIAHWSRDPTDPVLDYRGLGIEEASAEVLSSGFLTNTRHDDIGLQFLFLPVTIERQVKRVLIVGFDDDVTLDRHIIDIYLAVASLIGAVLQRGLNEEELRSHRTELTKLVEERTTELERSNTELQQFAYVASHDLQEPLRMVTAYLNLLESRYGDKLDGEAKRFLDFAVEGGLRARDLVNDLLEFSRVDTKGKPPMEVDMEKVMSEVRDNLSVRIDEDRALLLQDSLPVIKADYSQMVQVMQNLVSNGIKFHGKERPEVHISVIDHGSNWCFSVKDNGIGIDPEYKDKLFVLFRRLHTREEYEGTGIGLAISKKIVERHGGKIWFDSEPGKGTEFQFTIPKEPEE
ncbi:MAG TPA: ASKHA domain-containing protein [Methanomassiliicoccales archaeon]|jgi:uncharacterized 2Fe-2S/4Fe-4S cluster protein (DUF4445 family)/signal transduction histidine kinase